jgi:hypothetical protein
VKPVFAKFPALVARVVEENALTAWLAGLLPAVLPFPSYVIAYARLCL